MNDIKEQMQLVKPDPEIDRIWAEEARKRWMAYKAGKVETVSYEQVMKKHNSCSSAQRAAILD